MSVLESAVGLWQARNWSGSGDWLDENANGLDLSISGSPPFTRSGVGSYWTLNGIDEYMEIADNALLDVLAAGSFTAMVAYRPAAAIVGTDYIMCKRAGGGTDDTGWSIAHSSTQTLGAFADGAVARSAVGAAPVLSEVNTVALVRNVADDDVQAFHNGVPGAAIADTTTASLANALVMRIGSLAGGTQDFGGRIYGAAFFDRPLSDAEVNSAQRRLAYGPRRLITHLAP